MTYNVLSGTLSLYTTTLRRFTCFSFNIFLVHYLFSKYCDRLLTELNSTTLQLQL